MQLIKHKDNTVSLFATEESMKKIICLLNHVVKDEEVYDLLKSIDYDSNLHPDLCEDVYVQYINYVDTDKEGRIFTATAFRPNI